MNFDLVENLARTVLYEGYMLYPYRPSSVKNQVRFNFGVLYPESYSEAESGREPWSMQTECLVEGARVSLEVRVRFLHLQQKEIGKLRAAQTEWSDRMAHDYELVPALSVGGKIYQNWQEAAERTADLTVADLTGLQMKPQSARFNFPGAQTIEPIRDHKGTAIGVVVCRQEPVEVEIRTSCRREPQGVSRLTIEVRNRSSFPEAAHAERAAALLHSMVSTHTVLGVLGGKFVSLLDPPEHLRSAAACCSNIGTWPVLVGDEGSRDTMLSSPIILYDYPQIAAESPGDLFDGTEIDEILSLRIMTLTDDEKREMRGADDRARRILERTEALPAEQFMKLHGVLRGLKRSDSEGS